MLHPWVRRSYDDERKSALFFAVSNNDVPSARLLLEAGAMANQDPVKCLQVDLSSAPSLGHLAWESSVLEYRIVVVVVVVVENRINLRKSFNLNLDFYLTHNM